MADLRVDLKPGKVMVIGRKAYVACPLCRSIVRINKPLIGDLHICVGGTHEHEDDR